MRMPAWRQRFLATTRGRLITLLRRKSRTVNELAGELDLTDNAVRAHLSTLERDGLVVQSGMRRGVRKPNYAYSLTPEAEQLFPKAYAPMLDQLLTVLKERLEPDELEQVLREVGQRLAAPHLADMEKLDRPARVQKALDLLGELGGLAELRMQDGQTVIESQSCPLSAVVAGHPLTCRLAESLLSELIGVDVREQCEKGETPRCCFEVMMEDEK